MSTAIEEVVYTGRDNTIELSLTVDGVAITHTIITRVQLIVGAVTLDSQTSPALFNFTLTDRLILKLGSAGLATGLHSARLVIYDAAHPTGLVWEPNISLEVK